MESDARYTPREKSLPSDVSNASLHDAGIAMLLLASRPSNKLVYLRDGSASRPNNKLVYLRDGSASRPSNMLVYLRDGSASRPSNKLVYLSYGSAQITLRAVTLRKNLQIKLSTSPSHSILTPGQPVPVLTL